MKRGAVQIIMVAVCISLLIITGCHEKVEDVTYGSGDYFKDCNSEGIYVLYEDLYYHFKSNEPRTVYVYGKLPSSFNTSDVWVRYYNPSTATNPTGTAFKLDQNGGASYYNTGSRLFTAPLEVTGPNLTSGSFDIKFEVTDLSNNRQRTYMTFDNIPNRTYGIEYACMTGYDLRTAGYTNGGTCWTPFQQAFSEANTSFLDPTIGIVAIDPTTSIDKITDNDYLISWGDQFASNGANHSPIIPVIFSAKDYGTTSDVATGVTARSSTTNGRAYSFVFLKRCEDLFPSHSSTDIRVLKTRTAIHELTHARRKNLTWGYYTDIPPPFGYDLGNYKSNCLVIQVVEWDPSQAFHLCDGHRQMLMNVAW